MTFQPFGFAFEVSSLFSPEQAKAAIRSKKKKWFCQGSGARGWVFGSYVCLWNNAYDRNGPMLIGRITASGFGTMIKGRAGSDLDGVFGLALFTPLLLLVAWFADPGLFETSNEMIVGSIIYITFCGLVLWSKHAFRKEATPLVKFLERTLGTQSNRSVALPDASALSKQAYPQIEFQIDGAKQGAPSPQSVAEAVIALEVDGFVLLAKADRDFVQTLRADDGYILEWCDGSDERHFNAMGEVSPGRVIEAMANYLEGRQPFADFE